MTPQYNLRCTVVAVIVAQQTFLFWIVPKDVSRSIVKIYLPSATKLRRLCFLHLSVILFTWGSTWAGTPPDQVHPLGRYTPPDTPPPAGTAPGSRDGYCCGRYASYWNAFLYQTWIAARLLTISGAFRHDV